jgi:hypothetical protein
MRFSDSRPRAHNLLFCFAFLFVSAVTAHAAEFRAVGPLLEGLEHSEETSARERSRIETQQWRSSQRHFVLRFGRITVENVSWNGKREMDAAEVVRLARTLGLERVVSAKPEVSVDGPYGNFRVAIFEAENGGQCFVLRSFSGNNWPDIYDSSNGVEYPMGSDQLAGLFCRQSKAISAPEVQSLLDTIQ